LDDPLFDPSPAHVISRVTQWRGQTTAALNRIFHKYSVRLESVEDEPKSEKYDDKAKSEIATSFRKTVSLYGLRSKYEETMGRLSRFLTDNVLVENSKPPKISWWQKLGKLFELEESFYTQARDAVMANQQENFEIYSGLAKEALQQISDSIEKVEKVYSQTNQPTENKDASSSPKTAWWQRIIKAFAINTVI